MRSEMILEAKSLLKSTEETLYNFQSQISDLQKQIARFEDRFSEDTLMPVTTKEPISLDLVKRAYIASNSGLKAAVPLKRIVLKLSIDTKVHADQILKTLRKMFILGKITLYEGKGDPGFQIHVDNKTYSLLKVN